MASHVAQDREGATPEQLKKIPTVEVVNSALHPVVLEENQKLDMKKVLFFKCAKLKAVLESKAVTDKLVAVDSEMTNSPACAGLPTSVRDLKTMDVAGHLFENDLITGVGSCPWWHCHRTNRLRHGPLAVPLCGSAQIILCVSGHAWLQVYSALEIFSEGVSIQSFSSFFEGELGKSFLNRKVSTYKLEPGDALCLLDVIVFLFLCMFLIAQASHGFYRRRPIERPTLRISLITVLIQGACGVTPPAPREPSVSWRG